MAKDQVFFEDVQEGQEIPTLIKHPTRRQLVMWAGASGDFYEIHYDTAFARKNKLPDVVVHGRLKAAFLGEMLWDWMGPNGFLKRYNCRYKGTDPVDQDMHMKGTITAKHVEDDDSLVELDIWTEQPDGTKTTQGTATVALPNRSA